MNTIPPIIFVVLAKFKTELTICEKHLQGYVKGTTPERRVIISGGRHMGPRTWLLYSPTMSGTEKLK
jgi:hypothetical protein